MWKNSSKPANPTFMDPNNPHWGWSWLERWMAARPWESRCTVEKELKNGDHASVKSTTSRAMSIGDISRRRDLNLDKKSSPAAHKMSRPASRQSLSTPPSKAHSSSSTAAKTKLASPKGSGWGAEEDSRSMLSIQSDRYRRHSHSIAGSSVRDDESLASSPAVPSYMASTESTRARSRIPSPLGLEKNGTPERSSSAKKRLSFPASPVGNRRHSGPPRVEASSIKALSLHTEAGSCNGGSR